MSDQGDKQAVLDTIAAGIRAMSGMSDEALNRQRARWRAQSTGQACGQCERELGPYDPVWRVRVSLGRGMFGGWRYSTAPCCQECAGENRFRSYRPAAPCEHCGRPVHIELDGKWQRKRVFCCDTCRSRSQSESARVARSEARGTRECQECGETFEPTRADAKFCSSACKQKAYRHRVTHNEVPADETFASRNGPDGTDIKCGTDDRFISRNGGGAE